MKLRTRVTVRVRVGFRVCYVTVLHITEVVICRTVLHIMYLGVFSYLQDSLAYNPSAILLTSC